MASLGKKMGLFSFVFSLISFLHGQGCELVPTDPPDCMGLQAEPFITDGDSQFGRYIEGASTNKNGQIFAVNFGGPTEQHTIGQAFPGQRLLYEDALHSSLLNGIRFLNDSEAYVVDAVNHRVLRLIVDSTNEDLIEVVDSSVFCQNSTMLQPNDLTLSVTGTVFTSGMRWEATTDDEDGDIWSCTQSGKVQLLETMGRTNGIDLSPDESTLYVSESYNNLGTPYIQKIFKYTVNVEEGTISDKTLFVDFQELDGSVEVDIDGMKTDVNGNLFVTRHGGGEVVVFNPSGELIGKIKLNFPNPTNLEFGGDNGTTLFVVGACPSGNSGCVDRIEMVAPGRSWANLQQ